MSSADEKTAQELIKYLAQHHSEQAALDRHNSFRNVKGKRRDLQIHFAITKMPAVSGKIVLGEQELEFPQCAAQIEARFLPLKRENAVALIAEISKKLVEQLHKYGFIEE